MQKIIGPFSQIITLRGLDIRGSITDDKLEVLRDQSILTTNGKISEIGNLDELKEKNPSAEIEFIAQNSVALPGFVDAHTHICFAGSRASDYALRSQGKSYLEIAKSGGGIWSSVEKSRAASIETLADLTASRAARHLREGVTTIEVKSGYGLSVEQELKMLRAIKLAAQKLSVILEPKARESQEFKLARSSNANTFKDDGYNILIPTCLAAHMKPKDFSGSAAEYLDEIVEKLLPIVASENLAKRVDIFVEKTAFDENEARSYLKKVKELGFEITIHADQFSVAGSKLALEFNALSADHLEVSGDAEISALASSNVVSVALPNSSYGLGIYHMTPARKLLDAGAILAIASDWNPGSAPMGDLLCGAALFGIYEKLSAAEIFSALTFRAAKALNLNDRGRIEKNLLADFQLYATNDFREILYHQGKMKPFAVYKNGEKNVLQKN
jgi:imidazolonepropionase